MGGTLIWPPGKIDPYGMPGARTLEEQNTLMDKLYPIQHQWFMQFNETFFTAAFNELSVA
jgi:hypothetical protein